MSRALSKKVPNFGLIYMETQKFNWFQFLVQPSKISIMFMLSKLVGLFPKI